jgi:hypothetical protein
MMVVGLFAFGWFFYMPHAALTVDPGATEASGDFIVKAAPGMGYQYRWDADGNGQYDSEKFSDQAQVKVHLTEGQTQLVRLEIVNSFQRHGTAEVSLTRPVTPKPMQPRPPPTTQRTRRLTRTKRPPLRSASARASWSSLASSPVPSSSRHASRQG